MKLLIATLSLAFTFSAFANFMAERDAVTKFEKEEFINEKNYKSIESGKVPELTSQFTSQLLNDPKKLKYFQFLVLKNRFMNRYRTDKAFALSLEQKFSGTKLNTDQIVLVVRRIGDIVFSQSNTEHKNGFGSPDKANSYFNNVMNRLLQEKF